MKTYILLVIGALLFSACSRKEDAPPPQAPHIAGVWVGNGTDDAIGYYNAELDITQAGMQAAGTFKMTNSLADVEGNVSMTINTQGYFVAFALVPTRWNGPASRLCGAIMGLKAGNGGVAGGTMQYGYSVADCMNGVWNGAANLRRIVATN